jgi:hypothetical protein
MLSRSTLTRLVVAMVIACAVGCASAPRQRPIPGPDVDRGPESIAAARKFLEVAPSRLRYWEVKGDLLFLSTKDDAGKILSTGRWKRMP